MKTRKHAWSRHTKSLCTPSPPRRADVSKVYGSTYGAWQTLLSLPIARKDEIQRTMSDCPQETLESNRDKTCDDTSYFIARNEMSGFVMFCHTHAPKNAAIPALFFFSLGTALTCLLHPLLLVFIFVSLLQPVGIFDSQQPPRQAVVTGHLFLVFLPSSLRYYPFFYGA